MNDTGRMFADDKEAVPRAPWFNYRVKLTISIFPRRGIYHGR